jgi:hypothetical protein
LRLKARDIPGRIVTGGYILHSGLEKWQGDEERAKAIHGMAANAFPFLKDIPPAQFLRMLAAGEIAVCGAGRRGPHRVLRRTDRDVRADSGDA